MRSFARRLPILIALAVLATPVPVHAADEGGVGIDDHVVRVRARATIPAVRIGGDECEWRVVIEDDQLPQYDSDGTGIYSDTGRWFQRVCNGEPVPVNGQFAVPEGGGFSIPEMTQSALDTLDPDDPTWSASPDGVALAMVTQLPTWLWIPSAYWNADFVVRVETPSGRVWAEARATPTTTIWDTSDGAPTRCDNGGTPWTPDHTAGCSHTFRHSSAGTAGRPLSVTVEFAVVGATSINPVPAPAGTITRTSAPVLVQVAEIQALGTEQR